MTKKTGVKNRRLLFAKNSILMLVMLVVIFLSVFAWYYVNKQVGATGITVKSTLPDEVEVAVSNSSGAIGTYENGTFTAGKWANSIAFTDVNGFEFSSDVTSDGLTFLVPGFSSTEDNDDAKADARTNGKIVNLNAVPTTAINNLNITSAQINEGKTPEYYTAKFYIRSRNPDVFVKPSAYLAAKVELDDQGWSMAGLTDSQKADRRKSAYGNFSADAIVSAMRVSLTGGAVSAVNNSTYVPTRATSVNESPFVWIPRPDLFLNIGAGTREDNWDISTDIGPETSITRLGTLDFTGKTYLHNYYSEKSGSDGVELKTAYTNIKKDSNNNYKAYASDTTKPYALPNTSYSVPTLGVGCEISNFTTTANAVNIPVNPSSPSVKDNYYVYEYNLNLWIEGTDTEARRAMDTGNFSLYLEFGNSA